MKVVNMKGNFQINMWVNCSSSRTCAANEVVERFLVPGFIRLARAEKVQDTILS